MDKYQQGAPCQKRRNNLCGPYKGRIIRANLSWSLTWSKFAS